MWFQITEIYHHSSLVTTSTGCSRTYVLECVLELEPHSRTGFLSHDSLPCLTQLIFNLFKTSTPLSFLLV